MYRISNFLSKLIQHRKQLQPKPWRKCEKIVLHEIEVDNDFGWLKACPNKAKEYMKDENRYTDQYFKKDKGRLSGIKKFFNGLHSNVTDGVEATVERNGGYDYFYTYGEDKLPNLYRIKVNNNEDSAKELVIDQNHLSQETGYVSIGGVKISPCEKYVAFLTDVNLDGNYKCYVKEINPQASYLQIIDHVTSVEWISNDVLLFTTKDFTTNRSNNLWRSSIYNPESSQILYEENDKRYSIHLSKSKSDKVVFVNISSKLSCEVWCVNSPSCRMNLLWSRSQETEAYIDHMNDKSYCLTTNTDAEYCVKCLSNDENTWQQLLLPINKKILHDMELFQDKLLLIESHNLIPNLRILPNYEVKKSWEIKPALTPGVLEVDGRATNPKEISFNFTSPIQPVTKYCFDVDNAIVQENSKVAHNWDRSQYEYSCIDVTSKDGTVVPVSLFYGKNLSLNHSPLFCHFYGAYGVPVNLRFNQLDAYLLANGWCIAYAHTRGGTELGRSWYQSGRLMNKEKTFEDAIASVEAIHDRGISSARRTAIFGQSAGGLAVGVLLNRRPDFFSSAVLQVPFLSVLHAMLDENNYLATQEYLEWGNPSEKKIDFDVISAYCPYVNIKEDLKHSVFVTLSLEDDHVPYWVPLQWVAKHRWLSKQQKLLLCRIFTEGGHYGFDMKQSQQRDAEIISFLYRSLSL